MTQITIALNGRYIVRGALPLAHQHIVTNAQGESLHWFDGRAYEVRNRVALCRCGAAGNKPFCDGSHVESGFHDAN